MGHPGSPARLPGRCDCDHALAPGWPSWRGNPGVAIVVGLAAFAVVFAMNSSIHSDLILTYTDAEPVRLNVGFDYMANADGRLPGSLLSGWGYLRGDMQACLCVVALVRGALLAGSFGLATAGCCPGHRLARISGLIQARPYAPSALVCSDDQLSVRFLRPRSVEFSPGFPPRP